MRTIARTFQLIVSIILSLLILMQQRGGGLGAIAGGSTGGEFYSTQRGAEKVLFNLTVIMATLFCLNALIFPFLPEGE